MITSLLKLSKNIGNEFIVDSKGTLMIKMTYYVDPGDRMRYDREMRNNFISIPDVAPMCGTLGCHYSSSTDCMTSTQIDPYCVDYNKRTSHKLNVYKKLTKSHSLYLISKIRLTL